LKAEAAVLHDAGGYIATGGSACDEWLPPDDGIQLTEPNS